MKIFNLIKFSNTAPQSFIIGGLTTPPCNNLENLHEGFPPQFQDFNIPMFNRNASVNRLEKENAMKITQNEKNKRSINGNKKMTSSRVYVKLQHCSY